MDAKIAVLHARSTPLFKRGLMLCLGSFVPVDEQLSHNSAQLLDCSVCNLTALTRASSVTGKALS